LGKVARHLITCAALLAAADGARAAPDHVDITWMSITNMHFDLGKKQVLADGYITRLPRDLFVNSSMIATQRAAHSDEAAVREVFNAIGGKSAVNLLLTGHSHFDHSFDTATWARLSGARVIGSETTCLQVRAAKLPAQRCRPVEGGERIALGDGVSLYVIRWNHSGDPAVNPAQHNPLELAAMPRPDASGGFRAGLTEDFPNGGGSRAFLFVVDGAHGRFTWLFQDTASPVDLNVPIEVGGRDYGAPLDNLRTAMNVAGVDSVDLWIATGGRDVAALVLPVLKPKAYLPVHWDDLFGAFKAGPARPFADPALEALLEDTGVRLVRPARYMDKWRLDRDGIRPLDNAAIQRALGLP